MTSPEQNISAIPFKLVIVPEFITMGTPLVPLLGNWIPDRQFVAPTFDNTSNVTSILCGLPAICDAKAVDTCQNVTLSECQVCSMAGAGIFATVVLLLALCILLGNGFLLYCSLLKRDGFTGHYNVVKCSLAVADMLTGVQILFITLPHFAWTINMTPTQLDAFQLSLRGSQKANAGGVFYMLGYVASINHLIFMGFQRLYAILRPLEFKFQKSRHLYLGLALIWLASILSAVAPLWFSDYVYSYEQTVFLYNLTLRNLTPPIDFTPLGILLVVILGIPYAVMTITTIVTGFVFHFKIVRKWRSLSEGDNSKVSQQKKERAMFVTLALMQVGFTVTLIPLAVVGILSMVGALNCNDTPTPYLICFYLATTNSLVNVVLYSVRNKKFRGAIRHCVKPVFFCRGKDHESSKNETSSGTKYTDVDRNINENAV